MQNTLPSPRSTPVSGVTSGAAVSSGFYPDLGRPIYLTLSGTWTGTVRLLRSTDGGTTKVPLTLGGETYGSFTKACNEPVWEETQENAALYLDLPATGITYRITQ